MLLLRNFYRGDELFLDMFDDEYQSMAVSHGNLHGKLACRKIGGGKLRETCM